MKWKELFQYWLPYFLGGITVLGIFVIYVIYVGWENIFFFKKGFVQNSLGGREIGEIAKIASDAGSTESAETAEGVASAANAVMANSPFAAVMKKIGTQTYELLNYMWIQQKATLGVTLVMLFQWGIGLVKKGKWRLLLIPEILLVAFFSHTKISCYGGTTMYAYCFCWAPFLLCYLEKEEKRQGVLIFLILGLISAASFMAIGFTSIRTDKAHVGLYCGAMCTFLLMVMLARKEYFAGVSLSAMAVLMIAVCTMGMGYIDHFQGADIADCTYRMEKGIFKGMMTWEQDVQYENLRTCLEGFQDKEEATISITNWNYYAACLEGDLMERGGMNWLSYWEEMLQSGVEAEDVYGRDVWPDAVLIEKDEEENYRNLRKTILAEHFELVLSEYDYYLYIKKDDI